MIMRQFSRERGGIIVMNDKYKPGCWAAGVTPSGNLPMQFKGGFCSYDDAHRDAKQRYREARKTYLRSQR